MNHDLEDLTTALYKQNLTDHENMIKIDSIQSQVETVIENFSNKNNVTSAEISIIQNGMNHFQSKIDHLNIFDQEQGKKIESLENQLGSLVTDVNGQDALVENEIETINEKMNNFQSTLDQQDINGQASKTKLDSLEEDLGSLVDKINNDNLDTCISTDLAQKDDATLDKIMSNMVHTTNSDFSISKVDDGILDFG